MLPPPGEFGGTFYPTGYWDCNHGFVQNLYITQLDIRVSGKNLRLKGTASNPSFQSSNFTVLISPPKMNSVKAKVSYTLIAARDICVDPVRQAGHEGFRVARIASNYISGDVHDSDQVHYLAAHKTQVCAHLQNNGSLILTSPPPLGKPYLFLDHTDQFPRSTPTLSIKFSKPSAKQITPQGYVSASSDPNDDNVDLWGNWDKARPAVAAGKKVGAFTFTLEASLPGSTVCPPGGGDD